MAWQRIKLRLPVKLLVQAVTIFILLSATGECLHCYWCGPLAEQVHRSQRPPSCQESSTNVTACEPGYTHCAIAASSPPFVESRYCVKFYQDECYTLYCETTKTFRTICPCQGELCNGLNTQREVDAFAELSNTIAKTQKNRIKKRNVISSNFINKIRLAKVIENDPQDETANLIDNETKNETASDSGMQNDQPSASENENTDNTASSANYAQTNVPDSNEPNHSETTVSEAHITETKTDDSHSNESTIKEEPVEITKADEVNPEPSKEIENNNEIESMPVEVTENKPHASQTDATVKPTESMKAEEHSSVNDEIKPSMQLPTAEALQQSENLVTTEKPMEPTVTEASTVTMMSTLGTPKNATSKQMKSSKNSSDVISFNVFILLICLTTNLAF